MQNRIWTAVTVVAVVLGTIGVVRLTRTGPAPAPDVEVCADHDHIGSGVHEHGESCEHGHEGAADLGMSEEEILEAACEHGIPAHVCEDCRHEVGVVRVDGSIAGEGDTGEALVNIVAASRARSSAVLMVTGEVGLDENRAVHIRPRIPGILRSVAVDVGERVERDEVLFEMDSTELGRALGDFEKNRAMTDLARRNYEREKALYEQKISSEWDLIQSQMAYEEYQTELRAAETELFVLGLRLEDIPAPGSGDQGARAGRLPVRAPMAGTVIQKHAAVGERVDPAEEVMLIANLETVWIWADIYEQDLAALIAERSRGRIPVEVSVHAFPGRVFAGHIDYIGATMDEQTRTVRVRAGVANDGGLLRPGMFAEIRILMGASEAQLAVPAESVLADGGQEFVFRHLKEDLFVRRAVAVGRQLGGRVEILAGVEPGDLVVARGAFLLKSDVLRSKMGAG